MKNKRLFVFLTLKNNKVDVVELVEESSMIDRLVGILGGT
jgi:hypothetical protein